MKRKRKQASQRWNVSRNHLLLAPPPLKVSRMDHCNGHLSCTPHSAVTPTEFIFHIEGRVTILKYKRGHLLKIFCWFPLDVRHNVTLYHDLRAVSDRLHAHVSILYLLPFLIHLTSVIGGLLRTVCLAQGVFFFFSCTQTWLILTNLCVSILSSLRYQHLVCQFQVSICRHTHTVLF